MEATLELPRTDSVRWTTADLELMPDDGKRYEIIEGDLHVTTAPHWLHQSVIGNLVAELRDWSLKTKHGRALPGVGVVFDDENAVIPDLVWISHERLEVLLDESGHFRGAPEVAVEMVSPGQRNEERDRRAKLKLYSARGVLEYWIVDWRLKTIEVYRRTGASLRLVATLQADDELTSPLLPGFGVKVGELFA